MLADLAPPGRTGEALSFNSLALYGGVALGPVIGQTLLDHGGFDRVWIGAAALVGVAALLALRMPETLERSEEEEAPPAPLFHPAVLVPGFALLTGVAGMAGYFAFASLRAEELGLETWSIVLFLVGSIVVTCRIVFAKGSGPACSSAAQCRRARALCRRPRRSPRSSPPRWGFSSAPPSSRSASRF